MSKNNNFGIKVPKSQPTWEQYCKDIGSSKQVINRWLVDWFGREELIEQEIKDAESKVLPPTLNLINQDFRKADIEENIIDLILTDPPLVDFNNESAIIKLYSKTIGLFNALIGQIPMDLSTPVRAFKL